MNFKSLAHSYFEAFQIQDINRLSEMFSEDVVLIDWNSYCSGKLSVSQYIRDIFSGVETINIEIINLFCEERDVIAELKITIDETISDFVVDIISFDKIGEINSIKAFKR